MSGIGTAALGGLTSDAGSVTTGVGDMTDVEDHGEVRLAVKPGQTFGYARRVWAVMFGDEQRGWVVRPAEIGARHEAWSMHMTPRSRGTVGKAGLLGRAERGTTSEEERAELAGRFAKAHARGKVPTMAEIDRDLRANPGPARPRQASDRKRDISMRQALGGMTVRDARPPRLDENGEPVPGIGFIP